MKYERKASHGIYDHKFHLCWITKYRFPVLTGDVGIRLRDLVKQVCQEQSVEIIQGHVRPEHVHLVASVPPHLSISKLLQYIKGRTGRKLLQEFEHLRKRYYGGHLWSRGFYSATSGNITDQMIIDYVKNQDREAEDDDNFEVSG
ncbi:MAG: IS200/IS605 family transposase [Parcubacteria group bacterium CG1_02_44_65]|nr:MAG: IS200/IS605 family transposase [Parcubacteria group bacterium CG1_02_44_65]